MYGLPEVKKNANISFDYFPTKMQALIFRCWEMVDAGRIAKVLKTTEENVKALAADMGLYEQKNTRQWMQKGYITIIKAVWHLLPYSQIIQLLDWSYERLAFILKEDDFLGLKLGGFMPDCYKPDCEPVLYRELTEAEKKETAKIKIALEKNIKSCNKTTSEAFDFFKSHYEKIKQDKVFKVVITDEWCVEDLTGNPQVRIFAQEFKKQLEEDFGIKLCDKSEHSFTLQLDEALSENDEYHEIYIEENKITIKAPAPEGIMRGFYYLLELGQTLEKLSFEEKVYKRNPVFKTRYIYSFCGLYSDVLDVDGEISFPDALLKEYAKRGINGVWIQAVLYKLAKFPFDEGLSEGWQIRLNNLKKLSQRAARYGIKFYLYINEPRSQALSLFEKYPEIKGQEYADGNACLCTMTQGVQAYLKNALQTIVNSVPNLGGFFSITMSENKTNCCSHLREGHEINCPICSKMKPYDVVAKTIEVMAKAVFEANPKVKFFAWDWAWSQVFSTDEIREILKNIPEQVIVQCTSEHRMEYEKGGVKSYVDDYTLSMAGPSEWSENVWRIAGEFGHERSAKVQINNSWECSTAPFLPVYDTILQHMKNLMHQGVEHIMLSWTLGGYPSDNIQIASSFFFEDKAADAQETYDEILKNTYGDYADIVKAAATRFSRAFAHFPFHMDTAYFGPHNLGVANILFENKTGFEATMTGFAYDDLQKWSSIYPADVFENQFAMLCAGWEEGLKLIEDMPSCEFKDMAQYGYSLFKSSLNQIRYYLSRNGEKEIIQSEKDLAVENYKIMQRNCHVGYEAANHYYVNKTMLLEKIVQCEYLLDR